MVIFKTIVLNRLLNGFHGERLPSSLAILRTPALNPNTSPLNPNPSVPNPCSSPFSSRRSVSSITAAVADSKPEEIEPAHTGPKPRSLYSIFAGLKPAPVSGAVVPSKSTPLLSSQRHQPMEEKEFPQELRPEAAALVRRLHEEGYLKKANFYSVASWNLEKVRTDQYSRHFLKSAAEKFGQDHQEIAKWLSGSDLKKVALFGCPTVDRKTVFAAKKLRSFFSIQEDIVCRGCPMRSSCKFPFHRVNKMEKVSLPNTMRILTLLALDAVPRELDVSIDVKSSVCKLLEEVVSLTA